MINNKVIKLPGVNSGVFYRKQTIKYRWWKQQRSNQPTRTWWVHQRFAKNSVIIDTFVCWESCQNPSVCFSTHRTNSLSTCMTELKNSLKPSHQKTMPPLVELSTAALPSSSWQSRNVTLWRTLTKKYVWNHDGTDGKMHDNNNNLQYSIIYNILVMVSSVKVLFFSWCHLFGSAILVPYFTGLLSFFFVYSCVVLCRSTAPALISRGIKSSIYLFSF